MFQASSGRKRFNVLGAINAITYQLVTVINETYINAESVCELLQKIAQLNLSTPITLILDNARYQYCKVVVSSSLRHPLVYCRAGLITH